MVINKERPNDVFSPEQLVRIQHAVRAAESQTGAEILPLVVRRSSVVGHLPLLISLIILLPLIYLDHMELIPWHSLYPWDLLIYGIIAAAGGVVLAKRKNIQRLLTPDVDEIAQVEQRAALEFYATKMQYPVSKPLVLIFISLMEHRAVVLADAQTTGRAAKDLWNNTLAKLTPELKARRITEAILAAVEYLAANLPKDAAHSGKSNQIPDHVVLRDT